MCNIEIEKHWVDSGLVELKISARNEYVSICQLCYIQDTDLENIGNSIKNFSFASHNNYYAEFGKKSGEYTPAFSLNFFSIGGLGKIRIEVDMEIDDNDERKHRCCFYVDTEIGLVEQFGDNMVKLATEVDATTVSLAP